MPNLAKDLNVSHMTIMRVVKDFWDELKTCQEEVATLVSLHQGHTVDKIALLGGTRPKQHNIGAPRILKN